MTIGFNAVASLAAGKVAAATGFRNAEAVTLRRQGVPVRVFRVDRFGAPRFPELVLCTSRKTLESQPGLVRRVTAATAGGYRFVLAHPRLGLADLLAAAPGLDRGDQLAQLRVLLPAFPPVGRFVECEPRRAGQRGLSATGSSSARSTSLPTFPAQSP